MSPPVNSLALTLLMSRSIVASAALQVAAVVFKPALVPDIFCPVFTLGRAPALHERPVRVTTDTAKAILFLYFITLKIIFYKNAFLFLEIHLQSYIDAPRQVYISGVHQVYGVNINKRLRVCF